MKKTTINFLLSLSTAIVYTTAMGQSPVITSTNQLHAIGDSTVYVDANSFGFDPIPAGGPSVNWNYASLVTSGGITFRYEDPATAASSASFPGANEAMALSATPGHEWFVTNSNTITRLGYSDPVNGNIIYYGGGFVRYQFPFEAGDSWFTTLYTGTTTISFGVGEDSIIVENGSYSASVDAYGTVVLPTGTVNDVVRVHVLESFDLNVYIFGTPAVTQTISDDYYFWFADNVKDPILIYGTTDSGSGAPAKVLRYQPIGTVGINDEILPKNITIYPNPSNGVFEINTANLDNGNYNIKVHNIVGETVYSGSFTTINNNMQLDLSKLNKGIYFLNLSNSKTEITKRIIIK
jgi:hypothetical protein